MHQRVATFFSLFVIILFNITNAIAQNWEVNTFFSGEDQYHYRGEALAIDGNIALISGSSEAKSVIIFEYENDGWTQIAKLSPPDSTALDELLFGADVALEDDLILISSPLWNGLTGRVYGYEKPANGWADMTPSVEFRSAFELPSGANFGASIDISNDVVVIGAPSSEGDESESGLVYIYEKPMNGWPTIIEETAILYPSNSAPYDWFGVEVAIDGDVVAVGSARNGESGSAYIFEKPANGWQSELSILESATVNVADGFVDDSFGRKLDLNGNTLIASIAIDNVATPNQNDNAIYVFEKGDLWSEVEQIAKLTPPNNVEESFGMGAEVVLDGNKIYAGRWNGGSVLVFEKPGVQWQDMTPSSVIEYPGIADFNFFGRAIAVQAEHLLIGNRQNDLDTRGEVYFFYDTVTSIDHLYKGKIELFPNPSSGVLMINFPDIVVNDLMVYDAAGRQVFQQEVNARSTRIDLSALSDGFYVIHFVLANGELSTRKFVIK